MDHIKTSLFARNGGTLAYIGDSHKPSLLEVDQATEAMKRTNTEGDNALTIARKEDFEKSITKRMENLIGQPNESSHTGSAQNHPFRSVDGIMNRAEMESLFSFIRSNAQSVRSKITLMREILEEKPMTNEKNNVLQKVEMQLKNVMILRDIDSFKASVAEWLQSHIACGPNCQHLKAFYDKVGFDKNSYRGSPTNMQFVERRL